MAIKYTCYTPEQQAQYDLLTDKQRLYVDYRVRGMSRSEAYRASGFTNKNSAQGGYLLETKKPVIMELVKARLCVEHAKAVKMQEGVMADKINAIAEVAEAKKVVAGIEQADPDVVAQIQFYRDIANGKVKSIKKTTIKDAGGNVLSVKEEEVSDVVNRMKARKELDALLGITSQLANIGQIKADTVTINIVDAGRKNKDGQDDTLDAEDIGASAVIFDD